jgi:hypothetical protein
MRWLLFVIGILAMVLSTCGAGCLALISIDLATHPQSPIFTAKLPPGQAVSESLVLGRSGHESSYDVELARYVAPYRTEDISCRLRVVTTGPKGDRTHQDDARTPRARGCSLRVDVEGETRLAIDGQNTSQLEAMLHVAPRLTGGAISIKTAAAWLAVLAVFVAGAISCVIGFRRIVRKSPALPPSL